MPEAAMMNLRYLLSGPTIRRTSARRRDRRRPQAGQIVVLTALAMITMIGGVSLILEGGNAYAHQRVAQNAADAVANAGASVLAQKLGGATKTDADVLAAMNASATANELTTYVAYYTNVKGAMLTPAGLVTTDPTTAAQVGPADSDTTIPPTTQGVRVGGSQQFGTTFARVLGINQFTASAEAISITGTLTGGIFLPVVFPVNIVDCTKSGDLGVGDTAWSQSLPDNNDPDPYPQGQEYIVPLCKTGGGSFMILDLDKSLGGPKNNCDDEVTNPPRLQFADFPVNIASDNGNNCASKMVDEVNKLHGKIVLVPVCDDDCVTSGGSKGSYHIIRVAAMWLDYMSDSGSPNNPLCHNHTGASGQSLVTIRGNGSSSCVAGWFVRYMTSGPVGAGDVIGSAAIGIQLIR
jgi:Flp pilus assembly protein TadG